MIEVKQEGADLGAVLTGIAKGLTDEMGKRVLVAAQHAAGVLRKEAYAAFPDGRTGELPRSFVAKFVGWSGVVVSAAAHSSLIYADIQNDGGTVKAKNAQHLAVPLPGVPLGKGPRDWGSKQLIALPRRGRDTLLATVSKTGKVKPQYVLKREVKITGKHYIERAAEAAQAGITEILAKGIEQAVEKAGP